MKIMSETNNVKIEIEILNQYPFIKTKFYNNVTDIQKELIYRICLESYTHMHLIDIKCFTQSFIKPILLNKYNELYKIALGCNFYTVVSYLLSKSLIKTHSYHNYPITFRIHQEPYIYKKHYISLLDVNILEKRPDIFSIKSLLNYIKYSDAFIDNNFKEFLYIDSKEKVYFDCIEVQKPSFEILVKHISEFNLRYTPLWNSFLTEEQIDKLELLDKIIPKDYN